MGQEYGNRFFGGCTGESAGYIVAPELQAHCTDGRSGDCVGDTRCFDVKSAEGEVGGLGGRWNEGVECMGGRVKFSIERRGQLIIRIEG